MHFTPETKSRPGGGAGRQSCMRLLRGLAYGDTFPDGDDQMPMIPLRYRSTRDASSDPALLSFDEVLLSGLAGDGGLYVPERLPALSREEIAALAGLDYPQLAARIMGTFIGP